MTQRRISAIKVAVVACFLLVETSKREEHGIGSPIPWTLLPGAPTPHPPPPPMPLLRIIPGKIGRDWVM